MNLGFLPKKIRRGQKMAKIKVARKNANRRCFEAKR